MIPDHSIIFLDCPLLPEEERDWIDDIGMSLRSDRRAARIVLGAVLRPLRDRLSVGRAVRLGECLPPSIAADYFDGWQRREGGETWRTAKEYLRRVAEELRDASSHRAGDAVRAVFGVLIHCTDPRQVSPIEDVLPDDMRALSLSRGNR